MTIVEVPEEPRDFRHLDIQLTTIEQTLRRLLLDVAKFKEESPVQQSSQVSLPQDLAREPTVLRFTGGWVRDKLLGSESHDIDVSINNMTGEQFGRQLKDYLEKPGNAEKYGLAGVAKTDSESSSAGANGHAKIVGGLHKIEANPEKSKHLETITTRILGLDIDLVNLRKETYTEDSRNPQVEFGTPEEDALRRDATINAMFYNLDTEKVEDFTGRGFDDMAAKIIRTPLEPYQTFKDDPLRVLRLIRFASRLGFSIEHEAARYMTNEDIKAALKIKISRERVGVELEKMLRGPDPFRALSMISDAGLYKTVFSDPTPGAPVYEPDTESWPRLLELMRTLAEENRELFEALEFDPEDEYCAWNLLCLVPYRDGPQPQAPPNRRPPPPMATVVAREGYKATNKVSDLITASIKNREEIQKLAAHFQDKHKRPRLDESVNLRERLGMAIRKFGPTWHLQTVFALLTHLADVSDDKDAIPTYKRLVGQIQEFGLSKAYDLKPIMDGKQLSKCIGIKPGPWMKEAIDVVVAWQFRNPDSTDAALAIEEVKTSRVHGELKADLVKHFLSLTIRPLFMQSRPQGVTEQGRKDTRNRPAGPAEISFDEEASKPWKKSGYQAVGVLAWTVENMNESLIETYWHLVVPPILSLIDDHEVSYKAQGCALLGTILQHTSPDLLAKTGLADVFKQALLPSFGFLPSLTPANDAETLLQHSFSAFFALIDTSVPLDRSTKSADKVALLDMLLRKGVLDVYAHCPEHVGITNVVLRNLCIIYDALELESIRHLKFIAPMINEILSNPFGHLSPDTLLLATRALQGVIRNGWPVVRANQAELLRGACLCWAGLDSEKTTEELSQLRSELQAVVGMLRDAIGPSLQSDLEQLLKVDPTLTPLLLA